MALAEGDRHGYAIIQEVSERTDGELELSAGTLYRSIHRMLGQRLITETRKRVSVKDDPRRRYYRLTPFGRKVAQAESTRLGKLVELARSSGLAAEKA
jgi:DNA-binding PadR family transcriptional regulator